MSKSVFCIATSRNQAERMVERLQTAGFHPGAISVLVPDTSATGDFGHVKSTKASEGVTAGVSTGGVAGGTLGLLAGIGAIAIPGIGPFIAAGPIMAALSGAALGATAGGIVGGLIGLGIPEIEAKRYEERLRTGNYLVSVHTEDGNQIDLAEEIFKAEDGEDISTVREASVPKP